MNTIVNKVKALDHLNIAIEQGWAIQSPNDKL